ncbi:MAG: DUF4340 domain-containing protein [Byssovorax sp.]
MSAPWRKHLTTIVLTAAALAAGVAVLWVDRGTVTTGEAEQRRKSLFEVWRADEVTEIEIDLHGEKAKIFRGATTDAGQRPWEVELGGARFAAEAPVVDQLLGALDMASVERRIPEGSVDRAAFGLDKPRLRIAVSMGRQHLALRIGGAAPTPADAVYAEVEGKGVVVVTRQLAAALEVEPAALRSRTLVPYSAGDLGALLLDAWRAARATSRARARARRAARSSLRREHARGPGARDVDRDGAHPRRAPAISARRLPHRRRGRSGPRAGSPSPSSRAIARGPAR